MTLALVIAVLIPARGPITTTQYAIDSAHAAIGFSVRRLAVSTLHGRFTQVSGSITYDPDDLSRCAVQVVIATRSIDTADKNRDRRLAGSAFLETRRYPTITFVSRRVEREGDHLVAVGDLTVREVTREVRFPFALSAEPGGDRIAVTGSAVISRKDFDLMWRPNPDLANLFVGDAVTIDLDLAAVAVE